MRAVVAARAQSRCAALAAAPPALGASESEAAAAGAWARAASPASAPPLGRPHSPYSLPRKLCAADFDAAADEARGRRAAPEAPAAARSPLRAHRPAQQQAAAPIQIANSRAAQQQAAAAAREPKPSSASKAVPMSEGRVRERARAWDQALLAKAIDASARLSRAAGAMRSDAERRAAAGAATSPVVVGD
jgi:hypothetical protein